MIDGDWIVATAGLIALTLVSLALFLAALRLFRGPSLADRIVALELIAGLMVGMISVVSIVGAQAVLVDVAIALALVGFLSAVAFARYIEKGSVGGRAPEPGASAGDRPLAVRTEERPASEATDGR